MRIKELLENLDPVNLIEFKNYIIENLTNICETKDSNAKVISNFKESLTFCKECGCLLHKNGKTKNGIQKYVCSECKKTYSETTGTIIYKSKLPFEVWKNVIDNLLNGFSVRRIAEENNISIVTSFKIRHKVLFSLKKFIDDIELSGNIQSDEKYFSINLKGAKPQNMPRHSKKRTSKGNGLKGISHHKVCIISAIDENDNLYLKVAGLGRCTTDMLRNNLSHKIKKVDSIIADSATAYQDLCEEKNIKLIAIPSGFHADGINNISEINGVHSQLETWISRFRGISTRHLQEYLDWFVYIFIMKKRFCLSKLKTESYSKLIINNNYISTNWIYTVEMPIDLNIAYAEYNYQS